MTARSSFTESIFHWKSHSSGFSLIELVIFIVVLSVGLVGIITAINQTVTHSADPMIQIRAVELGQSYLDEILPRRFDENSAEGGTPRCGSSDTGSIACSATLGPEGETRADYDDVDDYDGIDESPPKNALGAVRSDYGNYRVTVSVSHAGGEIGLTANDAKLIAVTVYTPDNTTFEFSAYRANF